MTDVEVWWIPDGPTEEQAELIAECREWAGPDTPGEHLAFRLARIAEAEQGDWLAARRAIREAGGDPW